MLTIKVPMGDEHFDEEKNEFVSPEMFTLLMEHSLVSLSKWESIYEKPFLTQDEKSQEEVLGYIKAMIVNPDFPPEVLSKLSQENFEQIRAYIDSKRSATWFTENSNAPKSREQITSELIYYWLTVFNIPFECENWHLNRLLNLVRICNVKNAKPQKMSPEDAAAKRRALNRQRQQGGATTE